MAKHLVKCLYCGKILDASTEEFVKPKSNRYAHKACHESFEGNKSKEEKDREALTQYIKDFYGADANWPLIQKQIKKYISEKNYSYSGILKSLKFFYEVRRGDKSKARGGIGIVEYVYNDAFNYYRAIWEAQQRVNESAKEAPPQIQIPTTTIVIDPPQRQPMRHFKKLFAWLEEEVNEHE